MWNVVTLSPVIFLVCLGVGAGQPDERQPPPKPDERIKVILRFSEDELDPLKPGDSFLECRIHNGADQPIRVPTVYIGGYRDADMKLIGGSVHLVHWAGKKEQKFAELPPGQELTVFKAALRKLLLLDKKDHKRLMPGEPRYYWSWDR
jgi:hypothetical protein